MDAHRRFRIAAAMQALATVAGLATGIALMMVTGSKDGAMTGVAADRLAAAQPLLVVAELVKLVGAAAFVGLATGVASPGARDRSALILGLFAAVVLAASAAAGLAATLGSDAQLGRLAGALGVLALALGGVFSIWLIRRAVVPLPVWLQLLGLGHGLTAVAAWPVPPFALLAALLGIGWWGSLALRSHSAGRAGDEGSL